MHEDEIRPEHLMARYLRLSGEDAKRFFPDVSALFKGDCPGCGCKEATERFVKNGFPIVDCKDCGSLFANPRPTADQLSEFYRDCESIRYWATEFSPAVAEVRRPLIFAPRAQKSLEWAAQHGPSPQVIIDVGAGAGLFLEEVGKLAPKAKLRAVEPGLAASADCRSRGLETFEGFANEAAEDQEWAGSADLVVSFEVLEHLPEPKSFLESMRDLARPGGLVLVSGNCGDGFDIQVLGSYSRAATPPHHLTFLSQKGTRILFERAGMELLHFETPGKLDVEIAAKGLKADDNAVSDPFLRHLLLDADQSVRDAFQTFLSENGLSSHMWILARRPL